MTFIVPVVGDAPSISLDADWRVKEGDTTHYYSGSVVVAGCARGESSLTTTATLEVDHTAMQDLGAFIEELGAGPVVGGDGPLTGDNGPLDDSPVDLKDPLGCGCSMWRAGASCTWHGAGLLALALVFTVRRRRPRI